MERRRQRQMCIRDRSLSGDVVSTAVVVSTRPGTGQLVDKEVSSIVVDSAAPIARRVMAEAADYLGIHVPEVESHIAITVKFDGEVIEDETFIGQLSTRLPGWYTSLGWAGIIAEPMDEDLSLIHISEPTRRTERSRMPSSA